MEPGHALSVTSLSMHSSCLLLSGPHVQRQSIVISALFQVIFLPTRKSSSLSLWESVQTGVKILPTISVSIIYFIWPYFILIYPAIHCLLQVDLSLDWTNNMPLHCKSLCYVRGDLAQVLLVLGCLKLTITRDFCKHEFDVQFYIETQYLNFSL